MRDFSLHSGHHWNLVQEIVLAQILKVLHSPALGYCKGSEPALTAEDPIGLGSKLAIATSIVLTADTINRLKICEQKLPLAALQV